MHFIQKYYSLLFVHFGKIRQLPHILAKEAAGRGADRRRYERFAREEMLRRGLDPDAT